MKDHSFAVMVYKDSPFLQACIDSLKAQTVASDIFITTSTPSEYITSIANRNGIPVYSTESGKGIAHDWNFALYQAQTKYVTLAHQDDVYLSTYTEKCLNEVIRFDDNLICFTDYNEIAGKELRTKNTLLRVKQLMLRFFMPVKNNLQSTYWKWRLLAFGCPIGAPTVMYCLDRLQGFEFSSQFTVSVDWEAWSRLAIMKGRFVFIPEALVHHRIHAESETSSAIEASRRLEEDGIMFRKFWPVGVASLLTKLYTGSYKSNEV